MLTSTATSNAQPATIKLMSSSALKPGPSRLAPAKSSGGDAALNSTRRRHGQRCRLLRRGRCGLGMIGRRCGGERIGHSRLRRGENTSQKNCGKGRAEHGEILSVDGSKPTEADAPSL